jgi:hypothetical protein
VSHLLHLQLRAKLSSSKGTFYNLEMSNTNSFLRALCYRQKLKAVKDISNIDKLTNTRLYGDDL